MDLIFTITFLLTYLQVHSCIYVDPYYSESYHYFDKKIRSYPKARPEDYTKVTNIANEKVQIIAMFPDYWFDLDIEKAANIMTHRGKFVDPGFFNSFQIRGYILYSHLMEWRQCVLFSNNPDLVKSKITHSSRRQNKNAFAMSLWSCKSDIRKSFSNDAKSIFTVFAETPPYLPLDYKGFNIRREFFYAQEFGQFLEDSGFENIYVYTVNEHIYEWIYHLASWPLKCGEVNTIKNAMLSEGLVENIRNKVKFCLENVYYMKEPSSTYSLMDSMFNVIGRNRSFPYKHKAISLLWYIVFAPRDHYRYDQFLEVTYPNLITPLAMESAYISNFKKYFTMEEECFSEIHQETKVHRVYRKSFGRINLVDTETREFDKTSATLVTGFFPPLEYYKDGLGLTLYTYYIKEDPRKMAAEHGVKAELNLFSRLSAEFSCVVFYSEYPYQKTLDSPRYFIHNMEQAITHAIFTMQSVNECMPNFLEEHDVLEDINRGTYDHLNKNIKVTFVFPREVHNIMLKGAINDMLNKHGLMNSMTLKLKGVKAKYSSGTYFSSVNRHNFKLPIISPGIKDVDKVSDLESPPYISENKYNGEITEDSYNMVIPAIYKTLQELPDTGYDKHFIIGLTEFAPTYESLASMGIQNWTNVNHTKYEMLIMTSKSLIDAYKDKTVHEGLNVELLHNYNNLGARIVKWILDRLD